MWNKSFQPQLSEREAIIGDDSSKSKSAVAHLKIADRYVDLMNELPMFRDLPTTQLFKLLHKRYHKFVPPIGEDLPIREAAYQREERMTRAVIIGMLAKPEHIEQHQAQKFLERL